VSDDADYAAHWWRLAMGDLTGAKAMSADEALPPRLAATLAHQAAEKALKAAIALTGEEPPRTHDLVALATRLAGPPGVDVSITVLRRLSDAQIRLRYPEPNDPSIDWNEVRVLIEAASDVIEQVRASLERQGLRTDTIEPG
jgi:Uncharacterized conserved protein related to C-terminal domain of eukaryotic chaperone, SACSIN